jgi:hypothetical protein
MGAGFKGGDRVGCGRRGGGGLTADSSRWPQTGFRGWGEGWVVGCPPPPDG